MCQVVYYNGGVIETVRDLKRIAPQLITMACFDGKLEDIDPMSCLCPIDMEPTLRKNKFMAKPDDCGDWKIDE